MASEIALKIAPVFDGTEDNEKDHVTSASEDEQDSESESKHENLLKAIASLSSKEKKKQKASQQRSEPNQEVSEFHLSVITDTEQQVGLHDLIGSLQKSSEHGVLKKKLDSMQRNSGTLDVPLPKPEVQKIQRTIAYEETSKDVEKWAPTVKKNREAEHLSFPLKPYQPPAPSLRSLAVNFKPRTPLEEEVAAILKGSSHMLERKDKELTEEEEQALLAMDLEEAKERRHELQKLRALQSYYEAKCHRMRKIKSKKYHRVKKKAEKRAAEKIFEGDLQNEDPELAKEALEKAERLRATERVSLKHKNTSKWAKQLIAKGGKNPDTKKLLQDQLLIGRTLTKKTAESDSDEEMETPVQQAGVADDEDKSDTYGNLLLSEDNPWKLDGKGKGNSQETTSSFDYDSSAKLHKLQPITARETGEKEEEESEPSDAGEAASEDEFELQPVELVKKKTKKLKRKGKVAEETKKKKKRKSELSADNDDNVAGKKAKKSEKTTKRKTKKSAKEDDETEGFQDTVEREQVDSAKRRGSKKASKKTVKFNSDDKIIGELENSVVEETGKTIVRTERHIGEDKNMSSTNSNVRKRRSIGDETTNTKSKEIRVDPKKIFRIEDRGPEMDDSASSSLQQKRIDIQQAFANDDVVEEFVQEKSEIEDAAKPKDIDLSLPGWGSWAGVGVKPSKSKKTVVTKKADPAPPRKDKGLSHVIISEEKSKWLVKNQVSSVPHPFNNHVQFERSVRNPVGKHWNTGSTVNQLTKPRVSTLIGTPIEPIKATKEIKRRKPGEGKQKGKQSPGIKIHS